MPSYHFAAVATAAEVTTLLMNNKASKARVAAVGKDAGKFFNVWYIPTDHDHHWHFTAVQFDPNTDTDTKSVTDELDDSDFAAVTFFGQDNKYYVWSLK
ncbi:hypothetical protein LQ327_00360 [Actinomycetospora endophytica]|uniref:Uncharacterized protein n=1 Tax=Actinomycetospora endophytica TaxID=2291215 RepID=A0ABS8P0R1_9PSEU|nr:hypothetical protein [Actinomycetospora endophytica]MCD2191843.1 hypothetical protein [Actinomycetospora endophytica]